MFPDNHTMLIRPVEVFGQFENFQMFNYTESKFLQGKDAENKYGLQHPITLTQELDIIPKDMPKKFGT